jgi:propanol-preferring alcohol dehydrogenase
MFIGYCFGWWFWLKAQVLQRVALIEDDPLVYLDVDDPVLGPFDVLVRIKACGVCHSNIHMIEGDWVSFNYPSKLPIIPGHEISGVIEEVGRDVVKWSVGQRVGVEALLNSCRHCDFCLSGREHLCLNAEYTGETVDGGYAEYISVPWDFVFELPDNLSFEESAPFFCPGVTAFRAVNRAGVKLGQRVAVIGVGGVGHMSLQFAKLAGAETTAVDVSSEKMSFALELGADFAVSPREFEKMGKFDVIMVHAPSEQAVKQASKLVKRGGTVLMAVFGNVNVDISREYNIKTSIIGPRIDVLRALSYASKGLVKMNVSKVFKLKDANRALFELKKGRIVGRSVLTP